jgi:anti-sigma factor RsiW
MTCQDVQTQLPLWVEGDLPDPETGALEGHLARCGCCREAAEALRASQAWLKAGPPPPFTEADHAQVRQAVLDRIRAEATLRPAPFRARRALLWVAAGGLFVLGLTLRWPRPAAPPMPGHRPPLARQEPAPAPPGVQPPPRRLARNPRPESRPEASALTRIELQTSNPQIRIIWLARTQAPAPATEAQPF